MGYMKATEYANQKIRLPDGSLVSVVIWLLPESSDERPHGSSTGLTTALLVVKHWSDTTMKKARATTSIL
jgi:hypothetical protein